ncbi:glycine cleavage system protein R [Nocardioides bruguierae]|uniref:glycine cleavage system protein R n=1 Tax=Nocardioides bruguierae TaxID=2945102 RepID=UPI0020202FA7|nr:ACT domain-containing protein [Nocardioides bruguierae]MCL8024854.1 amino acid-binding ACT protein [Nocardioides bruguierae]
MATLVLTVIGDDRAGLVSALSAAISDHRGSWQRSEMARLAGKFAGVVLVDVPDRQVVALEAALVDLSAAGLTVGVAPAQPESRPEDAAGVDHWYLHLVGQDRPGILAEVSAALAGHGVGIEELATSVTEAPMAGGLLFEVEARLSVPADLHAAAVSGPLEQLADELMVDLTMGPGTDQT